MSTYTYEIILYRSQQNGAYIAEVPERAGCAADRETHQEALGNVAVVTDEWIETAQLKGRPIPQPKGKLMFA